MENLNNFQIKTDGLDGVELSDYSISSNLVSAYFRNLESKLIQHITEADALFGAVAWLTSFEILDALSKKSNVSIIVQKEDFLRPDLGVKGNWKDKLKSKYSNLKCELLRYSFQNVLGEMSVCGDPSIGTVRCVGNHNRDKKPAFPRMHNKFLIFSKISSAKENDGLPEVNPYAVWTGSFNFTKNAGNSLENALYITDPVIVNSYFNEYSQIAAISEPLDWSSEWAEPEWRIGT